MIDCILTKPEGIFENLTTATTSARPKTMFVALGDPSQVKKNPKIHLCETSSPCSNLLVK